MYQLTNNLCIRQQGKLQHINNISIIITEIHVKGIPKKNI